MDFPTHYPAFFTATNLWWKPLLANDSTKDIICSSLQYLSAHKRVLIYAFVIMPNHMHLIWQMCAGHKPANVQRDFLKYTGQQMKFAFRHSDPQLLEQCRVNAKDREYQFWERNALSVDVFSTKVFEQKLAYIHWNPVKAGLSETPESYRYSSAAYYANLPCPYSFLTHWWNGHS